MARRKIALIGAGSVVFAKRLAAMPSLEWLEPVGRLAWPWV